MSCQRYRHAIVDHALGADLDSGAAAHLEACPACLEVFDGQRRLSAALDDRLHSAVTIDHSPRFVAATLARIESSPRTVRWWQAWWPIPAAAALAAIAIAAGIPFRGGDASVSAPPPRADARVTQPAPSTSDRGRDIAPPPAGVVREAGRRAASTAQRSVAAAGVTKRAPLAEPVVMVPAAAAQAVRDYMTMVRRGTVAVAATEEPRTAAPAADLTIESLSVQSLDLAAMDEINPPGAGKPRPDAAAETNAANEER